MAAGKKAHLQLVRMEKKAEASLCASLISFASIVDYLVRSQGRPFLRRQREQQMPHMGGAYGASRIFSRSACSEYGLLYLFVVLHLLICWLQYNVVAGFFGRKCASWS